MGRAWLGRLATVVSVAVAIPGCFEKLPAGEAVRVECVFGALGDTPGRFAYPRAICADSHSNSLWVIDKLGRVQQLSATDGRVLSIWRMPETQLGKPVGVSIGPGFARDDDHLLYVPDTHYSRIMVYRLRPAPAETEERIESRPELVASFGTYGTGPGELIYPCDVAILPTPDGKRVERLYVSEYGGNDRVIAYDASFNFLFSFGAFGQDESPENIQFNRPQSVDVDTSAAAQADSGGRGRLVVTDSRNHRVGVFTLEGRLLRWIGSAGSAGAMPPRPETREEEAALLASGPATFRIPYGLELLGDGTALVAEFESCRVQRVDLTTRECLGTWGHPGRGDGELASPWGIATLGERTFILDSGNNRVIGFQTPLKIRIKRVIGGRIGK